MDKLRLARRFGLLGLLLAVGGCGGGWTQMKTKRFTGYAEVPRDFRYTLGQLEYSYAALASFFPKAEVGTVEVLFLPSTDLMLTFGAGRGALVLPTVPGGGRIGRRNLIVMGPETDHAATNDLLTYLFLHQVIPNAPLWLHESLARYFATTQVQAGKDRWRACFGFPAPMDTRFFQMPLDKFFAVTWQQYPKSNPGWIKGTGRLLMDYVFHGEGGAHREKLPAILAGAARGSSGAQIMAGAFPGMTLEQLGQRISDYKGSQAEQRERGHVCPLPSPIDNDRAPDESDPAESPVAPEEIAQLMEALKRLPHGEYYPTWYPLEVLGVPAASGAGGS